MKKLIFILILIVGSLFIGCGSFNEAEGELHYYNTVSHGQQLLDLKKAYDKKIITKLEYDTLKTRIMNNTIDIPKMMDELKDKSED